MSETTPPQGERTIIERLEVAGEQLVDAVKEIFDDPDAKRVTIRNKEGKELLAIPLTWGFLGAAAGVVLAPVLTAVAAIGGAVAELQLDVERVDPAEPQDPGEVTDV